MKYFLIFYNKFIYRSFLKYRLAEVGNNFKLGYSSELLNPQYFKIGKDFFSGPRSYFVTNANNRVTIGDSVMFGPDCKIIGGDHDIKFTKNHMRYATGIEHMKSNIIIEDGAWIGSNSVVLSNAKIGEGSVVGAMSLVNSDIPPYTVAVGIPAKPIKLRFNTDEELAIVLTNVKSKYTVAEVKEKFENATRK